MKHQEISRNVDIALVFGRFAELVRPAEGGDGLAVDDAKMAEGHGALAATSRGEGQY